jgi:hypothetical protein
MCTSYVAFWIRLSLVICIFATYGFCENGVLEVEYNHEGEKVVQISLQNNTGKNIDVILSKLCYGFGCLITRPDGTPLLVPSAIPRANVTD